MRRLFPLILLAACLLAAGCSGDDKAAKPIQTGDYTSEPGHAAKK